MSTPLNGGRSTNSDEKPSSGVRTDGAVLGSPVPARVGTVALTVIGGAVLGRVSENPANSTPTMVMGPVAPAGAVNVRLLPDAELTAPSAAPTSTPTPGPNVKAGSVDVRVTASLTSGATSLTVEGTVAKTGVVALAVVGSARA